MAETDLIKLYSQRILELAAEIPHSEPLAEADARASKRSPLCGSTVAVDVRVDGDRLAALGQDVKACALGQASASILGAHAVGRTRDEIAAARDALRAMLKDDVAPVSDDPMIAALEVLTPARDYRNRHAAIMLAWEAVVEAMDAAALRAGAEAAARV